MKKLLAATAQAKMAASNQPCRTATSSARERCVSYRRAVSPSSPSDATVRIAVSASAPSAPAAAYASPMRALDEATPRRRSPSASASSGVVASTARATSQRHARAARNASDHRASPSPAEAARACAPDGGGQPVGAAPLAYRRPTGERRALCGERRAPEPTR
eukprot:scaffold168864_cov29-Tisochrysis_lutea.AAC.5